jgi:hypothetical protein
MFHLPYTFVLSALRPVKPQIKKMLGGYGLYHQNKLYLFLRDSLTSPEFNGVFVAVLPEFFEEMQKEIHTSRMEFDLDGSKNSWIFISEDLPDFEQKVEHACQLIKAHDARLGK